MASLNDNWVYSVEKSIHLLLIVFHNSPPSIVVPRFVNISICTEHLNNIFINF